MGRRTSTNGTQNIGSLRSSSTEGITGLSSSLVQFPVWVTLVAFNTQKILIKRDLSAQEKKKTRRGVANYN